MFPARAATGPSDRAEPDRFLNNRLPGPLMAGREPRREQRVKVPAPRQASWWNAIATGVDRKSREHGADSDLQRAASAQREPRQGEYVRKALLNEGRNQNLAGQGFD